MHNGFVYVEVQKEMYGLTQTDILIQELLNECLKSHGYYQSKLVHGLWKHEWRPLQPDLVMYNFCVKYNGK